MSDERGGSEVFTSLDDTATHHARAALGSARIDFHEVRRVVRQAVFGSVQWETGLVVDPSDAERARRHLADCDRGGH